VRPDFFIVGAAKCGTTALFEFLSRHPLVFMPRIKEPKFFCTDLETTGGVYTGRDYRALFADVPDRFLTGEASALYLYSEVAIQRLMMYNPSARIIVMLRHPVEAAHSLHASRWGFGHEDIPAFEAAWRAQAARLAGKQLPRGWPDPATLQYGAMYRYAPQVRVLTTSQEPLKLADEQVYRLGTLALPDKLTVQGAEHFGAVALFVARAKAALPQFALTDANVATVIEICRRLDGIPLAIELAAARVPLLGVEGLCVRLNDRFRVLTAGARLALRRHQTLRAALEWSYGLLDAGEQAVFRRLGVFAGSFDLDSAQRVVASNGIDQWAALDALGALVDKSLVVAETGTEPRYRLLETGRAFALEQLAAAGETSAAVDRHARAMLALFECSHEKRWTMSTQKALECYLADVDNLRAALDWAASPEGSDELLIALARTRSAPLTRAELARADEVFLTSSVRGIVPVAQTPDRRYAVSAIARSLQAAWHGLGLMPPVAG